MKSINYHFNNVLSEDVNTSVTSWAKIVKYSKKNSYEIINKYKDIPKDLQEKILKKVKEYYIDINTDKIPSFGGGFRGINPKNTNLYRVNKDYNDFKALGKKGFYTNHKILVKNLESTLN